MKAYATLAQVKRRLGLTDTSKDEDLTLAIVAATRFVEIMTSSATPAGDDVWDSTDTLDVDDTATAGQVGATVAITIMFYKAADVPFGFAGMSDQSLVAYVRKSHPTAEQLLYGQVAQWGVA